MNRWKVLTAGLLVAGLLTGNAWAISGSGTSSDPYLVNSATGSFSPSKSDGDYYVTVANLYSVTSTLYHDLDSTITGSYAKVTVPAPGEDGTSFAVDNIVVGSGEYVTLSAILSQTNVINGGMLTVSAGEADSECNTVQGTSDTGSKLTVTSGCSAKVNGSFAELNGNVALCGPTDVYGGTSLVTGEGQTLNVYGGTVSVTGDFSDIYVSGGATVDVVGDTEVTNYHPIDGTVNVKSNNTLCIAGNSVKAGTVVSFDAANLWGSLSSGTYDSVVGNWKLSGDVTIQDTTCAIEESHVGAAITTNGKKLTVAGGDVTTSGTAGTLTVTGGELGITDDTLADSVSISDGGKIRIDAGKTLCDGSMSLSSDDTKSIRLTTWGVLGTGTYNAVVTGPWEVPSGTDVTISSTECACSVDGHTAHGGAVFTGSGGTLTAAADGAAINGSFDSMTVAEDKTLTVSGDTVIVNSLTLNSGAQTKLAGGATLCDQDKSVCPNSDVTLSSWGGASAGTLPGSVTYDNLTGAWYAKDDVTVRSTGYVCGTHTHGDGATIAGGENDLYVQGGSVKLTGAVLGTVYVSGGTVTDAYPSGNRVVNTGGIVVGSATSATDGTKLDAKSEIKLIKGSFASITGTELTLAGDTVIYSTGDADSYAVINSSGYALTVQSGDVRVQGTFASIASSGNLHVTLAGDAVINGGSFGLTGNALYRLTVGGGTAHIEGDFKQVTVNDGVITDCDHDFSDTDYHNVNIRNSGTCLLVNGGTVTLDNGGTIEASGSSAVEAIQVKGGKLTIGKGSGRVDENIYHIYASSSSASAGNKGINVSGGECLLLDGKIEVSGTSSNGVQVFGPDAKFRMGTENNTDAYNSFNTPSILVTSENSYCVYVDAGGEAWLHAGDLHFTDKNSIGIYTAYANGRSGICHVWAGGQYGAGVVGKPLLYVHGENTAAAAMWVAYKGKFDIRGRGVLFEEPSDFTSDQYALYIHSEAIAASDYPLSGGTYNGKVRYVDHDISDLLAYNHYLRYDGASANYGYTDGTYGVRPGTMTAEADKYGTVSVMHASDFDPALSVYSYDGGYGEYFGSHGEYYTATDAEWELRQQMGTANGSYQIPAGIVRSDEGLSNAITLDVNVFGTNDAEYAPYWGVSGKQGDADVTGGGHVLYLAGRTVRYDGFNWDGDPLDSIVISGTGYGYDDINDWRQVFDVNGYGSLELRDSVLGANYGTNPTGDKTAGGCVGTGAVSYEWADDSGATDSTETRALYTTGQLDVVSAQIKAVSSAYSSGISVSSGGLVNIGVTDENTANQLIHILGGLKTGTNSSHGIYLNGGAVYVAGGTVGDVLSQDYGGNIGVENAGGTLDITGGILAGNTGSGRALWSTATSAKTDITGGCLYGEYLNDDANGGRNNGDSIYVTDGTVYLSMDAAHSGDAYTTAGYTEEVIPFTGSSAYRTADIHHIYNITVEGGVLYVGALHDYDLNYVQDEEREIQNYTRDNGYLLCTGGKTVFYDGIVIGDTTIVGDSAVDSASADFGTEFYVENGAFGDLTVKDGTELTSSKYYGIYGDSKLTGCVQLHGGSYSSIDVSSLTTGWSGVYVVRGAAVNHIIGFWSNSYDANDDGKNTWIRYNHYATVDTASRNTTGYWTDLSVDGSDESRFVGGAGVVSAASGKAVNIHKGAEELIRWLTSGSSGYDGLNGSDYKLRCNIWIGNSSNSESICAPYFHCAWRGLSSLPVTVGTGVHTLDTNNFGIFGDHADALIRVGSAPASALHLTNSNTALSTEEYENLVKNYAQQLSGTGVEVAGGTLTIGTAEGNDNTVTIKAYDDAVLVSGTGAVTLNAGEVTGEGSDTVSNGIQMTGSGSVAVKGGTVTGQADGIAVSAGSVSVQNATVKGLSPDTAGSGNGVILKGEGARLAVRAGADIQGGADGVYITQPSTVTVYGGAITGNGDDGIGIDADSTINIFGGTISGNRNGVSVAGAATVNISGDTADLQGGTYGISQNASGSRVTVTGSPVFTGNIYGFYKASVAAETSLGGGLYSGLLTDAAGEKLSDLIVSSVVQESALTSTRAAQADSLTVTSYVLKSGNGLQAGKYDDDGDAATEEVTYAPYFLLGKVTTSVPSGGGGAGGSAGGGAEVIVNGESQTAGTSEKSTDSDGRSVTTVTIDAKKLKTILDGQDAGAAITVPVAGGSDVAESVLTGETVKEMEQKEATLEIKTDSATYAIPASEIDIDAVSEKLGVDVKLSDISVIVQIAKPTEAAENAAEKGDFTIVVPPVDFTISCEYDGMRVEISRFDTYVKRTIALPDGVNPEKVTTGVVVKSDGTVYHVPTRLEKADGSNCVVISSLTNSAYAVVWHPVEFADMEGHWAQDAVNDMGSRMIVSGVASSVFKPDRIITRSEFAAIIVRALGLAPGDGRTGFKDVPSSEWYAGYVETAYAYGIVTGYDDDTFGPEDNINREQAVTMISRAMKITGLEVDVSEEVLAQFADASDISSYAMDGVKACVAAGLINGRDGAVIAPQKSITRAEIAVMVQRLLQKSGLI